MAAPWERNGKRSLRRERKGTKENYIKASH
jgi:hypothetical protein